MSSNSDPIQKSPAQKSLATAEKLQRQLDKILAAEKRQLKNENIVRLEKNGELSYETVRTVAHSLPNSPSDPNFYTEPPTSHQNGQKIDELPALAPASDPPANSTELVATQHLSSATPVAESVASTLASAGISIHEDDSRGHKITPEDTASSDAPADPLEDLLSRALSKSRRGRPAAFDDHNKGKLVALLSLGMSLRQAAAVLGVSHGTIRNTLKADPALAEEITAARFQAQLQPLACVIREARRSWKAATWLLKYLDGKIASHEETPDERNHRQERERKEFLDRASGRNVKTRHVLG